MTFFGSAIFKGAILATPLVFVYCTSGDAISEIAQMKHQKYLLTKRNIVTLNVECFFEMRKQLMDYSKDTHFQGKIKWQLWVRRLANLKL